MPSVPDRPRRRESLEQEITVILFTVQQALALVVVRVWALVLVEEVPLQASMLLEPVL